MPGAIVEDPAEIGVGLRLQRRDGAVALPSQLDVGHVVSPVCRSGVVLAPRLLPLDRPPDLLGQSRHQHVLVVQEDLRAEAAADVGRDATHLRLRDPEDEGCHQQAHDVWVLRAHPDRVLACRRLVCGGRATDLHRVGDKPLVDQPLLDNDLGLFERSVSRLRVSDGPVHRDIAGRVLVQLERTFRGRVLDVDDDVERLPVDVDQLAGVLGRGLALCHYGGDAGAGEGDAVDLECARGVDEVLHAAGLPGARKRRQMLEVLAGEDGDHAGGRLGRRRVDALDPGVRVRRTQDRHVGHPGQLEIVEVLGRARDQARVFDPPDGLTDERSGCLCSGRHRATSAASWTARTMFS